MKRLHLLNMNITIQSDLCAFWLFFISLNNDEHKRKFWPTHLSFEKACSHKDWFRVENIVKYEGWDELQTNDRLIQKLFYLVKMLVNGTSFGKRQVSSHRSKALCFGNFQHILSNTTVANVTILIMMARIAPCRIIPNSSSSSSIYGKPFWNEFKTKLLWNIVNIFFLFWKSCPEKI
jgi:hypothetical protein